MITIFTVGEEKSRYTLNLDSFANLQFIFYPIYKNRKAYLASQVGLMHSFATSHAVYMMHALEHISMNDNNDLFMLNPLIDLMPLDLMILSKRLDHLKSAAPLVLVTPESTFLGLYLPVSAIKKTVGLRFLTFTNFSLDFQLISNEWRNVQIEVVNISAKRMVKDEFVQKPGSLISELQAIRYIQALASNRNRPPKIVGISPYHAGDVLFCSLALVDTESQIQHIAVNQCYADIARKILPEDRVVVLDCDPPKRGANSESLETVHGNEDFIYFHYEIYPRLDKDIAFYYMRNWRQCDEGDFHFIDQWRNATIIGRRPLIHEQDYSMAHVSAIKKKSVLLHFDAGWDLKIYPQAFQRELVKKLKAENYQVTILTDKDPVEGSDRVVKFDSVSNLETLVNEHSLIVGMDSFPAHYAIHCLRRPTITLFASTIPSNADHKNSNHYRSLEQGLGCNPCRHTDQCPIYNTTHCKNFSPPDVVMDEINQMYTRNYQ